MEEIPGAGTMGILKTRLIESLSKTVRDFRPEYPNRIPVRASVGQGVAKYLDHTLLKQGATGGDFSRLYAEAREWETWSVCIPSNRVAQAKTELAGSAVKVCTVVGFPWGYANTDGKVAETRRAVLDGADEIDMVIAVGYLKDEDWKAVYEDIAAVVKEASPRLVKVILEMSELSLEEKILGAHVACFAGAAFLKTSTGFAAGGAVMDDIHLLREIAGAHVGVKASGGVRTQDFAKACIKAGVDRIGTSSSGIILGKTGGASTGY